MVYDETPPCKMIAFIAPNENVKSRPYELVVPVDEVEKRTGFDFFAALPDLDESRLEAKSTFSDWSAAKRNRKVVK